MSNEIKTINIKGKQYVEVAERLRLVHDQKRTFEVIESEPYTLGDRTLWRVVILVDEKRYKGNAEVKLTAKSGPDSTNPFECAETSALGRALAFAGFGTVESIASFDEVARAIIAQGNAEQGSTEPRHLSDTSAAANRAASPVTQQNKALQDLLNKSKTRAAALGVDWEDEKALVLGKPVPDSNLTAQQIGQINADLAKARGNEAS
jgi:hypothetical protein